MIDVVSAVPSAAPRGSGVPHCEQKRAPSGFPCPHLMQYTLAMSVPSLPFAGHADGAGTMSWAVCRTNSAG
jgi:hypothetical protein